MATMMRDKGALQRSFFTGFYDLRVSITTKNALGKMADSNLYLICNTKRILVAGVGENQLDHGVCGTVGTSV